MSVDRDSRSRGSEGRSSEGAGTSPGKGSLTDRLQVQRRASTMAPPDGAPATRPPAIDDPYGMHLADARVQRRAAGAAPSDDDVHAAAAAGTAGAASALPHHDAIQRSFGRHDVSGVRAHTDDAAAAGARAMGAQAFATGDHVAFAGAPSLHTAAHEAAHVIQQRAGVHLKGGVGAEGDEHERHADDVADRVVRGESAEALLDRYSGGGSGGGGGGVQRLVDETAMTINLAAGRGFGDAADDKALTPEGVTWRDFFSSKAEREHVIATLKELVGKFAGFKDKEALALGKFASEIGDKTPTEDIRARIPLARRIVGGLANLNALNTDAELKVGYGAFKQQLNAYHTLLKTSRAEGLLRAPEFVIDQVFAKPYTHKSKDEKGGERERQITVQGASAGNLDVEVGDALARMYDLKLATSELIALLASKQKADLVFQFTQLRDQQIDKDKDYLHAGLKASRGMTTMNLQTAIAKGKQLLGGGADKDAPNPFANEGDKLTFDTEAGYLDLAQVPGFEAFQKADPTRAGWLGAFDRTAEEKAAAGPKAPGAPEVADAKAAEAGRAAPKPRRPNIEHLSAERTLGAGAEGEVGLFESHEADYNPAMEAGDRPRFAGKTTRAGGREGHNLFREAAAYAKVGAHQNLPKVHGFGVVPHGQDKRPALIMDFVQGPNGEQAMVTLQAQMTRGEITPVEYWGAIQFVTRRLLDVVKHLGSKGLAHNDIKPENFVIGENGEPVMIDLGLHTEAGEHEAGGGHAIRGMTDKFAPAQLAKKVRSGEETDLFLVAASMLAGVTGWTHSSKGAWTPNQGLASAPEVTGAAAGDDIGGRNLLGELRVFVDAVIKPDAQAETKIAAIANLPFIARPLMNDAAAQNVLKGTIPAEQRKPTLGQQIVGLAEPDEKTGAGGTFVTHRTPPRDEGEEKRARDREARAAAEARAAGQPPAGGH